MMRCLALICVLSVAAPTVANPITITKSATAVSDPLNNLLPRGVPGAMIDYTVQLANPLANSGQPVRNMVFEEQLPSNVKLRVVDLSGANSGPVAFTDGAIVLGVGDSGLTYSFGGLGSGTDGLEFYDGSSWAYTPVADSDGCDTRVRAIRVKPVTTFKTGGSFTLRYRAQIR